VALCFCIDFLTHKAKCLYHCMSIAETSCDKFLTSNRKFRITGFYRFFFVHVPLLISSLAQTNLCTHDKSCVKLVCAFYIMNHMRTVLCLVCSECWHLMTLILLFGVSALTGVGCSQVSSLSLLRNMNVL
jgi:hypothetical protein